MDKLGELAGADRANLDGGERYLRVAVRDGRLVPERHSTRRMLAPRRTVAKIDEMKRQAERALNDRIALGGRMAQLIDEAKRSGCADLANHLEECFTTFLNGMPKSQKRAVLLSAYDAVIQRDAADLASVRGSPTGPEPRS
jgi:DNA-directed RNA polymerase specialized sigma24 family protein